MVLITGATGFLGKFIVDELLSRGYDLRVLVRNPEGRTLPWGSLVEVVEGDILDVAALEKAMEGVEYVVHAAAVVSFAAKERKHMKQVNVFGTARVVDTALEAGVKKLIHISSIAATGRVGKGEKVDETTPWQESKNLSHYSRTKRLAEYEVHRGVAEGLPAVMVNPGVILGSGDWTQGTPKVFAMLAKGFRFYNTGVTGYVGAKDVAFATAQALESDFQEGERFILVSENLSQREAFSQVATALGAKPPSLRFPAWIAPILGIVSEAWAGISGGMPLITRESMRRINYKTYFDASKAAELGVVFTPMKEVIEETAKVFLEEKGL